MKRHPNKLINRWNYRDTRRYLKYCREVRQNKRRTVEFTRTALDHALRWATSTPFSKAAGLRPTFPQYLASFDTSSNYRDKLLANTRRFLEYARIHWPDRYESVNLDWIESLRAKSTPGSVKKRDFYTVERVRAITSLEPQSLTEERDIAAVAMLFLSGMRVGAFVTLPLAAVHFDRVPVMVRQWPKLGIRTKFDKAANTYLLADPELEDIHQIAHRWHEKALAAVGKSGMWYTILTRLREFDEVQTPGRYRGSNFAERLRHLCERANIEYLSPHYLRHGHVVYACKRCSNMADLKAVSQNVMHESLITTDSIYSNMMGDEVAERIANLGTSQTDKKESLLDTLLKAISQKGFGAIGEQLFGA